MRGKIYTPEDFPGDIGPLIKKYDGVTHAERAAGIPVGYFGKVRTGNRTYTAAMQMRVKQALEGKQAMPKPVEIPGTCPPLLADLIRFKGSKKQAFKALGVSDGIFYRVMNGNQEMPVEWIARAKIAMGKPAIGVPEETPTPSEGPKMPDFVMWDGKSTGVIKTKPWGKNKGTTFKKVPSPIVALVEQHDGIIGRAATSMGMTGGALTAWISGDREFTLPRQKQVHAALHGMPAGGANSMGESFDKYETGFAICMMKGASFDRIADIAEILNAKMAFRKNTTKGWIIMYRMAREDLPKFKRLALRDAEEIVCP